MHADTFTLGNGSIEPQWTKTVDFETPEAAMEHARGMIEAEAATVADRPLFLALGRSAGHAVRWLGIWEWETEAVWKPGG